MLARNDFNPNGVLLNKLNFLAGIRVSYHFILSLTIFWVKKFTGIFVKNNHSVLIQVWMYPIILAHSPQLLEKYLQQMISAAASIQSI